MDWSKLITTDDLPEAYQAVVELIGLENTMKLAEKFHGRPIYLANPDKLFLPAKQRYFEKHFNKNNHLSLSVVTGLSVRYIYKLAEEREEKKAKEKQQPLF